jgi:hypothetical protein
MKIINVLDEEININITNSLQISIMKIAAFPWYICLYIGLLDLIRGIVYIISFGHIVFMIELHILNNLDKWYRNPTEQLFNKGI